MHCPNDKAPRFPCIEGEHVYVHNQTNGMYIVAMVLFRLTFEHNECTYQGASTKSLFVNFGSWLPRIFRGAYVGNVLRRRHV